MKKIVIVLIMLLLPICVNAREYNGVNIKANFATTADLTGIGNIDVTLTIFNDENNINDKKETSLTILKDRNYYISLDTGKIYDAVFNYGVVKTIEGVPDRYGLFSIESERSYDEDNQMINIELKIVFNNLNYDGSRYRSNDGIDNEEIENRKKGNISYTTTTKPNKTTEAVVIGGNSGNNEDEEEITISGSSTTTTTIIYDKNTTSNTNKENNKDSVKTLIIIMVIIGIVIVLFVFVTIIKIIQANKRV